METAFRENSLMPPRKHAIMRSGTVQQVLQVCKLFRQNYAGGIELRRAYEQAVRTVTKNCRLRTETSIRDACVRRLDLDSIDGFYELLSAWVSGESRPLLQLLK